MVDIISHGVSWRVMRVMACHGVSWRVIACYGVSWRVMACHGVSKFKYEINNIRKCFIKAFYRTMFSKKYWQGTSFFQVCHGIYY